MFSPLVNVLIVLAITFFVVYLLKAWDIFKDHKKQNPEAGLKEFIMIYRRGLLRVHFTPKLHFAKYHENSVEPTENGLAHNCELCNRKYYLSRTEERYVNF